MARRLALVVGVDRYRELDDLPAAAVDARSMAQILEDRCDFEVNALLNPSRDHFTRALTDLFGDKSLTSEDTLLLYFAGHGVNDEDERSFYLAVGETELDYPDTTAVTATTIQSFLTNTYAKTKVVMLDCCFSGMIGDELRGRSDGRVRMKAPLDHSGTYVLTATDRTGRAYEDPRAAGTSAFFTRAVLNALAGKAEDTDGDGWISVQDVAAYVQRAEEVTSRQRPLVFGQSVTGPIPLARTGSIATEPSPATSAQIGAQRLEPSHDPHAPLDRATWKKLLRYYVACIKREVGLSDWISPSDHDRARPWKGTAEAVFTGPDGPVRLPDHIAQFCEKDPEAEYFYGYPLVADEIGGRVEVAPLLLTPIESTDGTVEAGMVELNRTVLERWGLEEGEVVEAAQHFAANFRPGDPERLAEQVRRLADAIDLPLVDDLDPTRMSDELRQRPVVRGVQNLAVVWRSDGAESTVRNLVKDLGEHAMKNIEHFEQTALAALARRDDGPIRSVKTLIAPGPLNESQEAVVDAAMSRRLTVATGPPGTGKTALVTALCATAEAAGQSVLIASTNNRAVDGVHEKLERIAPGMTIRTGRKELRDAEAETLSRLLDAAATPSESDRALEGDVRTRQGGIAALRARLDAHCETEADLYAVHRRLTRIIPEHDTAALAILEHDDRLLERAASLARRSLRRRPSGVFSRWRIRRRFGARTVLDRRRLSELFEAEQTRRRHRNTLEAMPDPAEVWSELKELSDQRTATSYDYARALTARRIRASETAIRTRIARLTRKEKGANWKDFAKLLRHLPGWAVNAHSPTAIVPKAGLFDLVIIDEAAQCSTPHVLTLLMRAKRALIIGDPNQLRPVVKLSKDEDDDLRRAHGLGKSWMRTRRLGYVDESIYDACAAAVSEELLLDEHYRCDPAIAAVPNRAVYQGRLTVLTDRTTLALPADPPDDPAVQFIDVPGKAEHPPSGSCRNPAEADALAAEVSRTLSEHEGLSVGVVTPFKAQKRLIEQRLRHRGVGEGQATVGTIHTFQGGECDVILLSPVGAEGIRPNSAKWVTGQTNLWNVAITRAQSRLILCGDLSWWTGRPGLLTKLIETAEGADETTAGDHELIDRLQEALTVQGARIEDRETAVAGQPCHLLLDGATGPIAVVVDADGAPDGKRRRQLLARLDLMAAAGYRPVRVPAWRILAEPEAQAEELAAL